MSVFIRFDHPFLKYHGYESFSDIWEMFCCKVLNIDEGGGDLYIRTPPESGIDIYSDTTKKAYQCKSVLSGDDKGFNVTQAINSLHSALKVKSSLGWQEYYVCANVGVTGKQIIQLQAVYPDVKVLPSSYWKELSEKHIDKLTQHFRRLIDLPTATPTGINNVNFTSLINKTYPHLKGTKSVIFYFERRNEAFKIKINDNCTVLDFLTFIEEYLGIAPSIETVSNNATFVVDNNLVFDQSGEFLDKKKTLGYYNFPDSYCLCVVTTLFCTVNNNRRAEGHYMNMMTKDSFAEYNEITKIDLSKELRKENDSILDKLLSTLPAE